jgi:hypothetical protein
MDLDIIEFFEPEDKYGSMKATVHKSGKLGFSAGAAKLINFEENKFFKIGRKKGDVDPSKDVLFMIPIPAAEKDDLTFAVLKAGQYYYVKIKRLLTQMNLDYRNEEESISFDVDEVIEGEKRYFKLVRKKKK